MRANAVHLTEEQMWEIVKFVIEHKGVGQDEKGDFLKFRVSKKILAEEVNKELGIKINEYQITKSVTWHAKICNLFGNKMIVPPPQESVQEGMLKIEIVKLTNDRDGYKTNYEACVKVIEIQKEQIRSYKEKLQKIADVCYVGPRIKQG